MSSSTGRPQKVAIPRLQRNDVTVSHAREGTLKESRVTRACTNCRRRKVRCSGEMPQCTNCVANDVNCTYDQARRDRLKSAKHSNQTLADLLRDLSVRVGEADRQKIQDALEKVDQDQPEFTSARSLGKRRNPWQVNATPTSQAEAHYPASVGSNDDLDLLDEDLLDEDLLKTRDSRGTGYVGQVSEVQWLRTLQREADAPSSEPYGLPWGPHGWGKSTAAQRPEASTERGKSRIAPVRPVHESTFYLDKDSIELEVMVDPHELPSPEAAERLFDCFITKVHTSFPILSDQFQEQVRRYLQSVRQGHPFDVADKWRANLNLVFAIAARYSHLASAPWRGDDRDHLVYMTRTARLLGLEDALLTISVPDLSLIQATGLFALYYLVIGHVSKAWIMSGLAMRYALSLGLHLRNHDPSASASKKDTLARTWWSLHATECIVSVVTGRPGMLECEDCTVPLPQDLGGKHSRSTPSGGGGRASPRKGNDYSSTDLSSTSSTSGPSSQPLPKQAYLDAHISIGIITQRVLSSLYAPRVASRSWQYVQQTIPQLLEELDGWRAQALPINEEGLPINRFFPPDGSRECLLLHFYDCSTRILITRPCLCRTERRIKGQSDASASFNQRTAEMCVQAAQEMIRLLPDKPDLRTLCENGPWWSILHYMMQAMAVFLLELSYQSSHMTRPRSEISSSVKKLIRWLRTMRTTGVEADRAYTVIVHILRHGDHRFQADVHDLLAFEESHPTEDSTILTPLRQSSGAAAKASQAVRHSHYQSTKKQYEYADTRPTNVDPRLLANMDSPMPPFHSQPQPGQHPYLFVDTRINSSVYSNPFFTSFDQDVQIPLTLADLWPQEPQAGPFVPQEDNSGPQEPRYFSQ